MKKIFAAVALSALVATAVYAGTAPGSGVLDSPHDMNVVGGLAADSQGRVCAFCHTPHHAVDLAGQYNPLWSHQPTALATVSAYESPTFDAFLSGNLTDPLIGPSRLCMSCHDGAIAPDQHYGNVMAPASGRFASDAFSGEPTGPKNIAVGQGGSFNNDHPIGFDINDSLTDAGIFPTVNSTKTWLLGGTPGSKLISAGLYKTAPTDPQQYMTCATCHDVHNKDNVSNDASNDVAGHTAAFRGNYFVFAPQSGSQLCLSCHDK